VIAPPDCPPERLFRMLVRRPRPTAPLLVTLPGLEGFPLHVRALGGLEMADASDGSQGPAERVAVRLAAELIARAVVDSRGQPIGSVEDVGCLGDEDVLRLGRATKAALDVISPTYGRSDFTAWARRLKQGAKHSTNIAEALALGGCVELALGYGVGRATERPDRYFGVPLADMTDGQWMAYRAAREVYQEWTAK
jgi:hypothetical protein